MNFSPKRIASFVITFAIALLPLIAFLQRQAIFDYWQLRNYTASSQIVSLAERTTMTDEARRLFYVYHAELQEKDAFNDSCSITEKSIILGCYVDGQGIYIYNVTDVRLSGVQEVTAAHEVLHAAYERLNDKEQTRINALTSQVIDGLKNQRILDSVQAYRERDSNIVPNELHSIIGTEVRDIPAELETYYSRYFSDRKVVVSYSEGYEKAFTEREQKAEQLIEQIDATKQDIDERNAALARVKEELAQEVNSLESQRANADPGPFNARVRAYNANVQTYNGQVQQVLGLIEKHNSLINEYNLVVLEENELIKAIDSRPETIQQQ
ncbi:hypothetical protein H0X10_02795 [Candidatus Saccharibacteria bacterium]|nr:hypothetical protein [Candidatus Saccharibacteria bacterium]